jgi:hypothetical protein
MTTVLNHHPDAAPLRRRALGLAIGAALAASAAHAADFPVTTAADAGAGSLRDAISQANASAGPDSISFAGVDSITLTSGQIDITDDLVVNGPDDGVVISGNDASRVFGVTQQGASLELNRVVLTSGRTEDTGGPDLCGADTPRGGAICALGPLILRESRILDSVAVDNRAGALFVATDGAVVLEDCALISNTALRQGGAADVQASTITISNCTISGNSTTNSSAYGGALYTSGDVVIDRSTFSGNWTEGQNGDGAALWLRGDTFIGNSTFSGNATLGAGAQGPAIFSREGNLTMNSVTVTDNTAASGAAISFEDNIARSLNLFSTILANNAGPDGNLQAFAEIDGPITVNAEFSLFGDPLDEIDGTNSANVFIDDPELESLTDNGCDMVSGVSGVGIEPPASCAPTHAPSFGSPAVDAGFNEFDAFDQRGFGFPRSVFSGVDIGAIEFEGIVSGPPIPEAVPVPTLNHWTLGLLAWLLGGIGLTVSRRRREVAER